MATLNPYINFSGNTEEAFNFYRSVFGGDLSIFRFQDMPGNAGVPPEVASKIMHVGLKIGDNTLMGTDALESLGHKLTEGNNYNLSLEADSKEEADRLYNALSAGGKIEMPIADAMWGAYFGMFTDKFGMHWMVNYTYPKK
jgi:PhnB protein